MSARSDRLLGGLAVREFLDRYWQKRPLLVRGAVTDAASPDLRTELMSLACDSLVTSRLICLPRGDASWTLRHGPFTEPELEALPEDGWTLLVQEANRHIDGMARLLEHFRFFPNWRIDDVMVSFATDGAGVGPHVDRYDVFLLQAHGRRRWRITNEPVASGRLVAGLVLPILESFEPDDEWILEPGDMLYLPPGFAHDGVAIGESVTCSVGFRAPDPRELCSSFLVQLGREAFEQMRYTDPDLEPAARPGEIPAAARRRLRESARRLFDDDGEFDGWVGRFVTRPRRDPGELATPRVWMPAELSQLLDRGGTLKRSAPSHFAWCDGPDGAVRMFVGGEVYVLGAGGQGDAELLCGCRRLDRDALSGPFGRDPFLEVVVDLVLRGFLIPAEPA